MELSVPVIWRVTTLGSYLDVLSTITDTYNKESNRFRTESSGFVYKFRSNVLFWIRIPRGPVRAETRIARALCVGEKGPIVAEGAVVYLNLKQTQSHHNIVWFATILFCKKTIKCNQRVKFVFKVDNKCRYNFQSRIPPPLIQLWVLFFFVYVFFEKKFIQWKTIGREREGKFISIAVVDLVASFRLACPQATISQFSCSLQK